MYRDEEHCPAYGLVVRAQPACGMSAKMKYSASSQNVVVKLGVSHGTEDDCRGSDGGDFGYGVF